MPMCSSRSFAVAAVLLTVGLAATVAGRSNPPRDASKVTAPRRDWPMFGGSPARNLVNPFARNLPTDWKVEWESGKADRIKARKNVKWVARLGTHTYGGVVVSGGKVYIGTNNRVPRNPRDRDPRTGKPLNRGVLLCLRETDGTLLWQAIHDPLPPEPFVSDISLANLRSMPAVEGRRLYYVSSCGELVSADTEGFRDGTNDGVRNEKHTGLTDADIVWRLDMRKELKVHPHDRVVCSPLVVGDLVFVVTGNGREEDHIHVPAPEAPSFLAVNKRTGKVVWQDNSPTAMLLKKAKNQLAPWDLVLHGQWSSPAYAVVGGIPQVIFPGGDGWLRAFEPKTGKPLWKFDANPKNARFGFGGKGTRNHFLATPVVYENRVYIGTGQDPEHEEHVGHLWCIDMTLRGDVSPEIVQKGVIMPNPNSAVVWHYGGPTPAAMARKINRKYLFSRTLSTCAVHDGLVYAADLAGFLHCLDAVTGKVYWTHNLNAPTWCSPLWADGKIYLGDEAGMVHILAHGRTKRVLNTVEMDERVRGVPVAANGVLYIATQTHLDLPAIMPPKREPVTGPASATERLPEPAESTALLLRFAIFRSGQFSRKRLIPPDTLMPAQPGQTLQFSGIGPQRPMPSRYGQFAGMHPTHLAPAVQGR